MKAYLGIPLVTKEGLVLGSLCAIDTSPRQWTDKDQAILTDFAKLVEEQISLRERVAELARFDEQRALIQGELAHRIKNIFSVISSLLLVSSKTATDLDSFVRSITGRVQALSKANDFIVDHQDTQTKGLGDLFAALLLPFRRKEDQVLVSCADVAVGEKAAAGLALIIHELATNSAKYGALSNPEGHVAVRCTLTDGILEIEWQEIGGPPVSATPIRKGFGSKLVARTVESQLMGTITRDYQPDGLKVVLSIPVASLSK